MRAAREDQRCTARRSFFSLHLAVAMWTKEASPRCRASRSAAAPCHPGRKKPTRAPTMPRCQVGLPPTSQHLRRRGDHTIPRSEQRNCPEGFGPGGSPTCEPEGPIPHKGEAQLPSFGPGHMGGGRPTLAPWLSSGMGAKYARRARRLRRRGHRRPKRSEGPTSRTKVGRSSSWPMLQSW